MYYRGFYRGAPFCRFGFGSLFLLGGAFILGSIVAGNRPPWSRRFHHWDVNVQTVLEEHSNLEIIIIWVANVQNAP